MPEGYQAGSAYVPVLPDFRGFHKKIAESLDKEEVTFERFGDKAGARFTSGFSERLRAGFERLPRPVIKADADTSRARRKLDEAARDRKSTILVTVKTVGGGAKDLLASRLALGTAGVAALGPTALGLGAAGAGAAVAGGAALGGLAAFGAVAKGEVDRVTKAQQGITRAQQQFAAAELAYSRATTKAGRASAALKEADARKALAKANAQLTPSERQLGAEITGLSGAWAGLGKAEAPVIASALSPWARTATTGLGLLRPVVTDVSGAVEFLGNSASEAVKSPFWAKFSSAFGQAASVGILGFGSAVGHVADGLAHLFVTFEPDIEKIPGLVDKAAGAFDRWAQGVHAGGLEKFLSTTFSRANLTAAKKDLADVTTIVAKLGQDVAGFSPSAFTGMANVLDILAKLTPGQIEAIAGLYAATKLVGGAGNIAKLVTGAGGLIGKAVGIGGGAAAGAAGTAATAGATVTGGAAAGAEAGTSAGAAYATSFGEAASLGLPEAFALVGATSAAEGGIAGEASGAAAGTGFATGFGASAATEFGASVGEIVAGAAIGAGIAGFAVGGAAGAGFALGFGAAAGIVGAAVGRARGWVTSRVSAARSWTYPYGQAAASGFADGYLSGGGRVQAAAARTRGWVLSGARGLGGLLFPAGVQVIAGFLSGLQAEFARVQAFVSGIAGWIASHKGPLDYDRRLLVPHGEAIMGSLHAGLARGYGPVRDLISGMAPAIAGGAALPGVGRPLAPGSLRLTVTPVMTGDRIVDAIVSGLRFDIGGKSGGDVQRHLGQGRAR